MADDLDRLDRTVNQVLAAARAEARAARPAGEPVALRTLLEACALEVARSHQLAAGALRLEGDAPTVLGNAEELGLVFRNLFDNAVKYSAGPVDVRVRVRLEEPDRVRVEIADRGIGIPPRELRKIFGRFYRAGRDVQRKVAGLGLGLFIVRNLVRRQGGRVAAESEGTGRGSRFVVTLRAAAPRRDPHAVAASL
jgi:signal transduction histidine kinase